ncbi:MAG: hypothetical protein ACHQQS_00120 [Thermoanaerobaculales bacterium]
MAKTYRCPRFPKYSIGPRVIFEDGVFTTSDPELQHLVEINPWFGRHVFVDSTPAPHTQNGPRAHV